MIKVLRLKMKKLVGIVCVTVLWNLAVVAAEPPNFKDHVLPIFKEHCNNCHNPDKMKADLDLTSIAGINKGSSGGDVFRAGTPDSSVLYMVMDHEDGYEPMPPKKPKLDQKTLEVIHQWIAGGMIPHAGGESGLRDVSYDVGSGSVERPDQVAIPIGLSPVVSEPAPVLAVAASPWTDVFAVAGHREVRIFAPSSAKAMGEGYQVIASDDLLVRLTFDERTDEGILGAGWLADGKPMSVGVVTAEPKPPSTEEAGASDSATEPEVYFDLNAGFTVAMWLKSKPVSEVGNSPNIFGTGDFRIFLEPSPDNWKLRLAFRDQDRRIGYYGRVGEIRSNIWTHVALTFDGRDIVTYFGGSEVVRQPVHAEFKSFFPFTSLLTLGAVDGLKESYKGGIDDFRIYQRALSGKELSQISQNGLPQLELAGALPFDLGTIHQLRFSRNGSLLLVAGGRGAHSGAVNLYNVNDGKLQATIGDEQDIVLAADISSDHSRVALGGPSKAVKIFTTSDGKLQHRITKHTDWVTAVRFSPDGALLATGDRNGAVHVWEADTGGIVFSLSEHKESVTDIAWRADGSVLATTGEGGKLVLWSMKDGFPVRAVRAHETKTNDRYTSLTGALDVAYLPDGSLFTSGRDRSLRLWRTDGGKAAAFSDVPALPLAATITHDGTRALTGHLDGSLLIWDLSSGKSQELTQ